MIAELHGVQIRVVSRAAGVYSGVSYALRSSGTPSRKAGVSDFLVPYVLKGKMSVAAKKAYTNLGITKKQFMDLMQICQAHQNLLQ